MGKQDDHSALTEQVIAAHEEMTGETPTPVEYGTIQAVVRDYLNEESK